MKTKLTLPAVLVLFFLASAIAPASADLWNEEQILAGGYTFGFHVSISGNQALVGDCLDDGNGSAYVFEKVGVTWTETAKLTASDGAAMDWFGFSVSISGDQAIVGAPSDDLQIGSAYVFEKIGDTWTETGKLTADDGAEEDFFGAAVSISTGKAVVGAYKSGNFSGAVYIFEKVTDTWTQVEKFTPNDAPVFQRLGYSVSISGDQIIAGAYRDNDVGSGTGSAYIYEKVGDTWVEADKLTASDAEPQELFGSSVGISGDTVIVSAWHDDDLGDYSGSAYIFEKVGDTWTEVVKLTASDGVAHDNFGCSASISGDQVIVGAYRDEDYGPYSGSAYIFEKIGDTWTEVDKLTASDAEEQDWFGYSVAISGDQAIVGTSAEAAYVFVEGASQTFGLVSPENETFLSAPPVFEWTAAEYDVFRLYIFLRIGGVYYPLQIGWMPLTSLDLMLADPLWTWVDLYSAGFWLVVGVNTTTGAFEATAPWWFLKIPEP